MSAAERLSEFLGRSIGDRREGVARNASDLLALLEAGELKEKEVARQAIRLQQVCEVFCFPPPPDLRQLFARLLKVAGPARGEIKDRDRFNAAAEVAARRPDATPRMIARIAGLEGWQHRIAAWLDDPEFREIVAHKRVAAERARDT